MDDEAMPRVVFWQRAYCAAMGALYGLLVLGSLAMIVFNDEMADASTDPGEVIVIGVVVGLMCAAFAAAYLAGLFLPRRRWVWVYHIVLIAIGMTSCACLPFVVPLLIFWIRPDVQAYFSGPALPPPVR